MIEVGHRVLPHDAGRDPHLIAAGGAPSSTSRHWRGFEILRGCGLRLGGLISLTKQVAVDYGVHNVRCNVVCPGATKTEMFVSAMTPFAEDCGMPVEEVFRTFAQDTPLRRVSETREIGGLCSFLASDDSSFLTAAVIPHDGGAVVVDVSGAAINQLAAQRGGTRSGEA